MIPRLRWLLVVAVALAAILLAAAWLLPSVLDWNRYRSEIAALASDTLAQKVTIEGPIALTLLPQPMLTAARVNVAAGDHEVAVSVARLRVRVALGALLAGRIDARELVLQGADIRIPWPLEARAILPRAPPFLTARIEDGRLSVGKIALTDVNATLTSGDFTASYMLVGSARAGGDQRWRFNARLTRPGADGSAALDLTLDGEETLRGTHLSLSAQFAADGSLAGRATGYGPDLSQLLPAPSLPFRAEGRVTIAGGLAAADDLVMDLGGAPARGAVALRVLPAPRLDLAITSSRLDLDAWMPVLLHSPSPGAVPSLPIGIDLSAEAAQLSGGMLRSLRTTFELNRGVAEVRELTAILPGEASLRVAGRIAMATPQPAAPPVQQFDGFVALTAPTLRTTLAWLQAGATRRLEWLPPGVLHTAALAGHTVIEPGRIAMDGLTGTLDDADISGSLALHLGVRPAVVAALALDRLDLDAWLTGELPALSAVRSATSQFDADVKLQVQQAKLRSSGLGPITLDGRVEAGHITLRNLEMRAGDVHATATGELSDAGRIEKASLDLQAAEAEPLAEWLPDSLAFLGQRGQAFWHSPVKLSVLAAGAPASLGVHVTAAIGDLRLEALPTLDLGSGIWNGTLTLRHPGASRLAEALGLPGAPAWLGEGSFSLVAQLSGNGARLTAERFELAAGATRAQGTLTFERGEPGPSVAGEVTAETLALPLPKAHATDPLPIDALLGWQGSVKLDAGQILFGLTPALHQFSATIALADGTLRVAGLSAKIGGGDLSGGFSLDASAEPPAAALQAHVVGATVSGPLFQLPVDVTGGVTDATIALTASGHSPAALLATLGGEMRLSVRDGSLAGIDMDRVPEDLPDEAVRAALSGGSTGFDRLDVTARADHGNLQITGAALRAVSGTMGMTGSVDLAGSAADLRLTLRPAVPDSPEIGLRLNGPLDSLRKIPELAAVVRWRAGERAAGLAPPTAP
jgi:uncharacterized protein involved in outer membrane biogenesis